MSASTRVLVAGAAFTAFGLLQPATSYGAFHLMQIEQVIGGVNGDMTAQAIQLRMRSAGQNVMSLSRVRAWNSAGASPVLIIDMTTNVPNGASGARVLICSAGFSAYTTPAAVCNFTMTSLIPSGYLAAGSLTFEDDGGTILWRLSWGGTGYTGTGAVDFTNDSDGNANPPFGSALPSSSLQALQFTGAATALSTNNLAQYAVTAGAAVFINNGNSSFTVTTPTPTGTCCISGNCTITTEAGCAGTWTEGGSCMPNPCPPPTGECCITGDCTVTTQASCAGTWTIGGTCTPNLCPAPTGACCEDPTGICTEDRTQAACEGDGFRYGGDDSECATISPPCVAPPPPFPIALELIAGENQVALGPATLSAPLGITHAGDGSGRLFIHDQIGLIRVIDAGGNLLPDPMLDISALLPPLGIDFGGGFPIFDERGLLGLAFHPDFNNCPSAGCAKFYVHYSLPRASTGSEPCDFDPSVTPAPGAVPPSTGKCHEEVIAQYTMMDDDPMNNEADPGSEIIIFRWDKPQWNHNAGHIEFGTDGMLYISTGDGGGANDGLCDVPPSHGNPPSDGPGGNGQNRESKLGKMIRIDVDGNDGPGGLYGIPPSNPFVDAFGLDEVYAYGFRNPFRFSFDDGPGGDNTLYLADVGQDIYEEVNDVLSGGNYGWAIREGAHCFEPPCTPLTCPVPDLVDPISEYTHAEGGTAIIGGYVYRGSAYPQLVGKYVYGDDATSFFVPSGRLYYFDLTGPEAFVRKEFYIAPGGDPLGKFLKGFGRDADGEIYVAASGEIGPNSTEGVIYKIIPPPPPDVSWNVNPLSADRTTRSLRFTVQAPASVTATGNTQQMAIKVTMIDLQNPSPPNLPQFPPPDYSAYESGPSCTDPSDCARWVGRPGTFFESQGPPLSGPYRAARLQCTPFYWDWITETQSNPITVVGAEIVPSSEYSVQMYAPSCKGMEDDCTNVSGPVTMFTRRFGDVDEEYNPPSATNQPNAIDVAQLVNKFKNIVGAPVHARAQLQPNLPELNASINALDIVAVVDAVKGLPYAFPGPCPCPSSVTCGGTCTGCPGLCVKTCTGGDNSGEPCINNNHCPGGSCAAVGTCRDQCGRCTP